MDDTANIKEWIIGLTAVLAAIGAFIGGMRAFASQLSRIEKFVKNLKIYRAYQLTRKLIYDQEIVDALKLLAKLDWLSQIFADTHTTPIFLCDGSGDCTYANDAICELFGLSKEKMLGNGWTSAVDENQRHEVWKRWEDAIADEIPCSMSYKLINQRTGKESKVRAMTEKCCVGGQVVCYFGTVKEIEAA